MLNRYGHDVIIAIEDILSNKVRSLLTALGIIFGVGAVISMMAIGSGAQQEIIEQIKLVGVNNIIIKPLETDKDSETEKEGNNEKKSYSPGLTLADAEAIKEIVPSVNEITGVISKDATASREGRTMQIKLEGVEPNYFTLFNLPIKSGKVFSDELSDGAKPVCIIGENIRAKMFKDQDPIGQYIKVSDVWTKVIGIIEPRDFTASASDEMGISSSDNKIIVPIRTMLIRFGDRYKSDFSAMKNSAMYGRSFGGDASPNQLDKIVVQVKNTEQLAETAELLRKMLMRRHRGNLDFEVTVPELLLKQQQQTNRIFNVVLGAIAGISLLVGGIGIMNIMLASVLERVKEIGTRQAIGATRMDIIVQFLSESTLISFVGGLLGIILGIILSYSITLFSGIKTIITPWSVLIAFTVSSAVGITFGYIPAKKAAMQDPVESLRQ